jgi:hypothetical protein
MVYTSGDSAFVPQSIGSQFNQTGIRSLGFVELGPSAGYAYTAVFKQHFFLTGSLQLTSTWVCQPKKPRRMLKTG